MNGKIQFSRTYRSLNGREGGKDGVPVKYDMNLIENNELYNLSSDPEEKINVYDRFPEIAKKMEKLGRTHLFIKKRGLNLVIIY